MIDFIVNNWSGIAELIAAIIGLASLIVKLTPTLRDDNFLLPIVKFIGKFIALNRNSADDDAARAKMK